MKNSSFKIIEMILSIIRGSVYTEGEFNQILECENEVRATSSG